MINYTFRLIISCIGFGLLLLVLVGCDGEPLADGELSMDEGIAGGEVLNGSEFSDLSETVNKQKGAYPDDLPSLGVAKNLQWSGEGESVVISYSVDFLEGTDHCNEQFSLLNKAGWTQLVQEDDSNVDVMKFEKDTSALAVNCLREGEGILITMIKTPLENSELTDQNEE